MQTNITPSNFYVTLPSNGSKAFYKNTAATFRNHLADPLELAGQWEVALMEIQYPLSGSLQQKPKTPALYVYADVVADEYVGDSKVPLLRSVPIEGNSGETAAKEFIRPYYKPVSKGYISSILIEIKDDTGKDIEFTEGKVICILHFRRCGLAP